MANPELTVCFGWDKQLDTFFAWVGPDKGDCDSDELWVDLGSFPSEIPHPEDLRNPLRDHHTFTDTEMAALAADKVREGGAQRHPVLQSLLDSMTAHA